jgi:hypothetical protein
VNLVGVRILNGLQSDGGARLKLFEAGEKSLPFVGLDKRRVIGGVVESESLLYVSLVKVDDVVLDASSRHRIVEKSRVGAERL